MDSTYAWVRVCGYVLEYVGFPDVVEDDCCYWTGDDWEFVAGEAIEVLVRGRENGKHMRRLYKYELECIEWPGCHVRLLHEI